MNSDIKEPVTKSQVWTEFQASNPQQPLQTHKVPDRPWSQLAVDLFTLQSKDYIALVDYYITPTVEVRPFRDVTSFQMFWSQIMDRSLPEENLPSSQNSKSNGKAELAIKVVKGLFKKALLTALLAGLQKYPHSWYTFKSSTKAQVKKNEDVGCHSNQPAISQSY